MTRGLESSVRPTLLLMTLLAASIPGATLAQQPCLEDLDCTDDGNACSDDLCATTTNLACLLFDREAVEPNVATVQNHACLNPATGLTLSAWVRLDAIGTRQAILDKPFTSNAAPYYQYHLEVRATGELYFAVSVGGVRKYIDTQAFPVGVGTWRHVAGTWDGTTMRLYRDGRPYEATTSASGTLSVFPTDLTIGNNFDATMGAEGRIDEVAIYGRALDTDEVRELMLKGFLPDPALLGRWGLDYVGSMTPDSSACGNPAHVSGAQWDWTSPRVDFGDEDTCFHPAADWNACDDGLWCTVEDACGGGACEGLPRDCDEPIACTVDACDEALDTCTHLEDDQACASDLCTVGRCETASGGCVFSPVSCEDGNLCTWDSCDAVLGCRNLPDDGLSCEDTDICNGLERCVSGTCVPGEPNPPPAEIRGVGLDRPQSEPECYRVRWTCDLAAGYYDVVGGLLSDLRDDDGASGATCWSSGSSCDWHDCRLPPPGTGEYVLVRARSCYPGTYGYASDGAERVPVNSCP